MEMRKSRNGDSLLGVRPENKWAITADLAMEARGSILIYELICKYA
ncbi:hypothetical protein R4Z10_12010 [Niallia sp. XMNu-256]